MIRKVNRRGQRILVIDIRFTKKDGSAGRYRHDARVQTTAAATAEERRLLSNVALYGDVFEPRPGSPAVRRRRRRASRSAGSSRSTGRRTWSRT